MDRGIRRGGVGSGTQAGDVAGAAPQGARLVRRRQSMAMEERLVRWIFASCALVSVVTTVGIVVLLLNQSIGFFQEVSVWEFITGTRWSPILKPNSYGVLPLVCGTVLVAVIASAVAVPVGLFTAIFLSEYAPDRVRRVIKPALEILAGIPTIVYGYFALSFVTPLLQKIMPDLLIFNALSAGIVMGLMIIPMVSSLSEDAMLAVPRSLRHAAYALGATRLEVALRVVVPAALSGIMASGLLALARAVGETMIVTIAAGGVPNLSINPVEAMQAMTAYIMEVAMGDTPRGTIEYKSIFAIGSLLFVFTLGLNLLAQALLGRFREVYD